MDFVRKAKKREGKCNNNKMNKALLRSLSSCVSSSHSDFTVCIMYCTFLMKSQPSDFTLYTQVNFLNGSHLFLHLIYLPTFFVVATSPITVIKRITIHCFVTKDL